MNKSYLLVLPALVAFAMPSFAQTSILNVTNAFVRNYHQSGAYGSGGFDALSYGTLLPVKNSGSADGTTDRAGLLQFDGTGIGTDQGGGAASSSSLTVYYNPNGTTDAGTYTWALWGIPTTSSYANWNGSANTWGTLGGGVAGSANNYFIQYTTPTINDLVIDANLYGGAPLATVTFSTTSTLGTVLTFSGTALDDFINSDASGDLSFILVSETKGNGTPGFSQDASLGYTPTLVTTVGPVPEPATLSLAIFGGLGLLAACRRRL